MDIRSLAELLLTIFVLLLTGLFLTWRGMLDPAARRRLNSLLIRFFLPCNIVISFIREFDLSILRNCAFVFLAAAGVQIIGMVMGRICYPKRNPQRTAALRCCTMISNASFLGIPVCQSVFGSIGVLFASIFLIPQRMVFWTAGVGCFEQNSKGAWKRMLTHPCMIAVVIGLALMVLKIPVPGFLYTAIESCGRCTMAVSMLLIGSFLYGVNVRKMITWVTLWFCVVRLGLIPLLVCILCRLCRLDHAVMGVTTLLSGMPAATIVVNVAEEHGGDAREVVVLVCISTILSLGTIPLITWLVMM